MVTAVVGTVVEERPDYVVLEEQAEVELQRKREYDERLHSLFLTLSKKRTEAINARTETGVESRWLEDLAAYHGEEGWYVKPMELTTSGDPGRQGKGQRRSRQFVQKTRQKTNAGSARLSDMLLPTDERNWEMDATPVPELMEMAKRGSDEIYLDPKTGQPLPHPEDPNRPLTNADMATDIQKVAREKAKRMEREVDDQLSECQFNAACRRAIDSAAQLGTGIIRGPVPMNRVSKKWTRKKDDAGKTFYDLETIEDTRPHTSFVSVWDAFPAPGCGEDPHKGGFFWHREVVNPSHLKDLARLAQREEPRERAGYMRDQLLECLKEEPQRTGSTVPEGKWTDEKLLFDKSNYELWNFWGEADVETLESLGIDMDAAINEDLYLTSVSVVVTICNDKIIRVILNPQAKGEIPFDFFQWERVSGSCWGVGVPFLMRYAQKAMNAAWRQMQDNAGVTHGPQVIINRDAVEPQDDEYDIYGMKIWFAKDDIDPSRAFSIVQIQSQTADLITIFNLASQLADEETSLPQLLQGDGQQGETMGAVIIRQNNANVVLKRFARNWDDQITGPHLRRYYDWNMEHNPNEEVKGDFFVKARGSTHLVLRDARQQEMMLIAQAKASDPEVNKRIDPAKWAKALIESTSLRDIMRSDEEVLEIERQQAEQPPPVDPAIQIAQMRAQTEVQKVQIENEGEQANIALQSQEAVRNDEREMTKLAYALQMKELEVQMAMMKFAHENKMQLNDIKAMFAGKVMDMKAKVVMDRENREAANQVRAMQGPFPKGQGQKPKGRR